MFKASCCCGSIRFELLDEPTMMGTCHCSRCRKVGASTFVFVRKDSLRWLQGKELVTRFEPESPHLYVRCFCSKCGSALGEIDPEAESFPIAANCLDEDPVVRNRFHEFVAEKPAWYDICDSAPRFEAHPVKS